MKNYQKKLITLIEELPVSCISEGNIVDVIIKGIALDSRQVKAGDIFICLVGGTTDGHDYIQGAIKNGAAAVVGTKTLDSLTVPYLKVENSREAMAYLAASLYDFPGRKMTVIGVTGTDGKTTTSNLIYHILKSAGKKVGLISTVNAMIGDEIIDTGFHVTTPEAPQVQQYLAQMVEVGMTHVVLETTSHGLAQHRVTGCEYDVAVYTNVTHEHLDYHGSYENYLATKGLLIEHLSKTHNKLQGNPRYTVLNADDRSFEGLHPLVSHNWLAYSTQEKGDLNASEIQTHPASIDFTVNWHTQSLKVHCPMPGVFNVSNCLAALGATVGALGVDFTAAVNAIPSFTGIPGRMERIEMGQPFIAIVDFAHTPNALKVALETTRPMTKGRVIAVFGSAGLRDVEKRKMMAAESVQLADMTILTAEDPRTESLDGILEEMALSASQHGGKENENFIREPDRGMAIFKAVQMAGPEDLVIACGKGHEQSMCFGSVEYPWDDRTAMRAALAKVLQVYGPEMPKLPTSK